MIQRALVAAALAAVAVAGIAPAIAQGSDPVKTRERMMEQNGKDAKAGGAMLKGAVPFDAAKAAAIFKNMNDVAMNFGKHFPAGTEKGTEASPAIWAKPADWQAALTKFQNDTAAAMAAKPQTVEAFGQQFGAVTSNCKSCHESFRVKKS